MVGNDAVGRWDYLGLRPPGPDPNYPNDGIRDNSGVITPVPINPDGSTDPGDQHRLKIINRRNNGDLDAERLKDLMDEKRCCAGKLFKQTTHCCINDTLVSREEKGTGIFRALSGNSDNPFTHSGFVVPPHSLFPGLEDPGGYPVGPIGPFYGGDGFWVKDDPGLPVRFDGQAVFTKEIFLSPCDYDIDKFSNCMTDKIVNDLLAGKNIYFNIIPGFNCRANTDAITESCKRKARR